MAEEIRIPEEVLCRQLEGEAVLLDLRSQHYFGLDFTGTRIWSWLQEGLGRSEIRDALVREFAVDPARAEQDLASFLGELEEAGLILLGEEAIPEAKQGEPQAAPAGG